MLKSVFFREKVFRVEINYDGTDAVAEVFARDEAEAIERAKISLCPWRYIWHRVRGYRVTEMGMDVWMTATGQPMILVEVLR